MDSPSSPRGAYSSLHAADDDAEAMLSTEFFSQRSLLSVGDLDTFFRKVLDRYYQSGISHR